MWSIKYRPTILDEVLGQETPKKIIRGRLKRGGSGHSWILSGLYGSGKTTLLRILAKALLCPFPLSNGEACQKCDSCRAVDNESSQNYVELDSASNGSIEQIRDLVKDASQAPLGESPCRVVALDESHSLSKPAQNALLKTLEDMPETTHFVLITTEPQKLLPTIRSRSLILDLKPVSKKEVVNLLKRVCQIEKIDYDEQALELIVEYKYGHVRDALTLSESISLLGSISLDNTKRFLNLDLEEIAGDIVLQAGEDWENLFSFIQVLLQEHSSEELWKSVLRVVKQAELRRLAPGRIFQNVKTQELFEKYGNRLEAAAEWSMLDGEKIIVRNESDFILGLSFLREKLGSSKDIVKGVAPLKIGQPKRLRLKSSSEDMIDTEMAVKQRLNFFPEVK